jgi:hypothetical protein
MNKKRMILTGLGLIAALPKSLQACPWQNQPVIAEWNCLNGQTIRQICEPADQPNAQAIAQLKWLAEQLEQQLLTAQETLNETNYQQQLHLRQQGIAYPRGLNHRQVTHKKKTYECVYQFIQNGD